MRILHVIPSLYRGGAERQMLDILSNTEKGEFTHAVAYLKDPSDYLKEIESTGTQVFPLSLHSSRQWIRASKKLNEVAQVFKPDLLHLWLTDAILSVRLSRELRKIPGIVSIQNPDYHSETVFYSGWPRHKVAGLRILEQTTRHFRNDTFVACSQFVSESSQKDLKIPASKTRLIYNSVNGKKLESESGGREKFRKEIGADKETFVLLQVARLDPQKGQTYLLEAFSAFQKQVPNSLLCLVGEGKDKLKLQTQAIHLDIDEKVLFLGNRTDIGTCLEGADVFVFPSLFEGFGIALAEAMWAKLPVVASRTGPLPEIISSDDLGVLVEPASSTEILNALLELYRNPLLRLEKALKASRSVQSRFSISSLIRQWEDLYRSCVKPH